MKLTAFRIHRYKSILDSGWIEISPLTVMVGKNESGKTTILKALHRFNPFDPEPYSLDREWPRSQRKGRSENQVVCSTRFALSAAHAEALKAASNPWNPAPCEEHERQYIQLYATQMAQIAAAMASLSPMRVAVHEYVLAHLPTFLFMDEYRAFRGSAALDEVLQRKQHGESTGEDRTLEMILDLSGLRLESEVKKAEKE